MKGATSDLVAQFGPLQSKTFNAALAHFFTTQCPQAGGDGKSFRGFAGIAKGHCGSGQKTEFLHRPNQIWGNRDKKLMQVGKIMGFCGRNLQMDQQPFHQLFDSLRGLKTNGIEIRVLPHLKFPPGGGKVLLPLLDHSLTVAFIQYLAIVQGFPDQGISFLIAAGNFFRMPGQQVNEEAGIGPVENFQ